MKGIILAGGLGTRLYPSTKAISKQLLPIYDKPMIYYPLATLMLAGIRDILIICTNQDLHRFENLLQDGSQWGVNITYEVQYELQGLADALIIGENFLSGSGCVLALGDNLFFGNKFGTMLRESIENNNKGATVFAYAVRDPSRYGIVELDEDNNAISIEEKPKNAKTNLAITGLYIFDSYATSIAKKIKPSERGEIEITSVNEVYLHENNLKVQILGRGMAWLDTGTHDSLIEAGLFVQTIEKRQGLKIASHEEISWRNNWISDNDLYSITDRLGETEYSSYHRVLLS